MAASVAGAQAATDGQIDAWVDSLMSPSWASRDEAVYQLNVEPGRIPSRGRTALVDLLEKELDGRMPLPAELSGEAYPEYMARLTTLVQRFNDPRATALLARQGIAVSMGSQFQVAAAGDAGVDPLLRTWDEKPALRPAVLRTLGLTLWYADSTGQSLSGAHRASIRQLLLGASLAPEPWVRRAFVDAAAGSGDPTYLPLVERLAATDPATLDGIRYVARAAGKAAVVLSARRGITVAQLVRGTRESLEGACALGWIREPGLCQSLGAKLDAAIAAWDRGGQSAAAGSLKALQAEVEAQRGKGVDDIAYLLLRGDVDALLLRLR